MARVEYTLRILRKKIPMVNNSQVVRGLQPGRGLPIGHQVDVTVVRKEPLQGAQIKQQFIVVAVSPRGVAKCGQIVWILKVPSRKRGIALGTPHRVRTIDPQVNDINRRGVHQLLHTFIFEDSHEIEESLCPSGTL